MSWVRLDDEFPDHKKVVCLSNDAFCLHITAMCWVAKWQTNGKLPSKSLGKLGWRCQDPASAAAELVAANVWEIIPEGWEIHDFSDYNPTKEQLAELSAKRSEAGKAGAMAKWQNYSKPDGKPDGKPMANNMPPSPSPYSESTNVDSSNNDYWVSDSDASVMESKSPPTRSPEFDAFELNFRTGLIKVLGQIDPSRAFMGDFPLGGESRELLLEMFYNGTTITEDALDWGLTQWSEAKPKERFRVEHEGCIKWLITTIRNSYKPGGKSNGRTAAKPRLKPGEIQVSRRQSDDGTEWIYFDIANGKEAYRQPRSESDLLF